MMTIITMIRCVFLINLIVVFSEFNEMIMKTACERFHIKFSYSLTLRSLLKSIPYTVTGILLLGFLFVFSYTLQKFELPNLPTSAHRWTSLWNGFWNSIITMTTVGYGDLFATTVCGRAVAVIIMFWGAFINSLILVAMQISATFTPQEQNVAVGNAGLRRLHLHRAIPDAGGVERQIHPVISVRSMHQQEVARHAEYRGLEV